MRRAAASKETASCDVVFPAFCFMDADSRMVEARVCSTEAASISLEIRFQKCGGRRRLQTTRWNRDDDAGFDVGYRPRTVVLMPPSTSTT